jgi:hypothetical protein
VKRILAVLAQEGAPLYERLGFRIVDSEFIPTFGGTGSVTLCKDVVKLRLWLDRDRLFIDLGDARDRGKLSWYSLDIVSELLLGTNGNTSGDDDLSFVIQNFAAIQERFSPAKSEETKAACELLETARSKRLFG